MFKKTVAGATLGATTLLWASPVSAQDLDSAPQAVVDNLWLVIAGALVFLMQAGFAFVEAGLTRAKNLANIMAKNLADMAIGVTMFFVVGYTIAYGSGGSDWLGGFGDSSSRSQPTLRSCLTWAPASPRPRTSSSRLSLPPPL